MKYAAEAAGGEHERHRHLAAENLGAHLTAANKDCIAGTERHFFEGAKVLAQSDFVVGAAVHVVKDGLGQALFREEAKIRDVHDARRGNFTVVARHRTLASCCWS